MAAPERDRVIIGLRVGVEEVSTGSAVSDGSVSGRTVRWARLRRICPDGVSTR